MAMNSNFVYPNSGQQTAEEDSQTPNPGNPSTTCYEIDHAASHLSLHDGSNPNPIDSSHPSPPKLFSSPQPGNIPQIPPNQPASPQRPPPLDEADNSNISPDILPTYGELKDQEGHRFGRWRGWIEKRARERVEERTVDRQQAELQGRPFGTGWDLPQSNQPQIQPQSTPLDRNSSIISARDERAAFKSASRNHKDTFLRHQKGKFDGSTSAHKPNLEPGPGAVNLTPSTSIHQIGSRFLPQFPSQPLCAIPLPLSRIRNYTSSTDPPAERFLLVGTIEGLYVCDLMPSLSSTVKKDMVSPTDSKIYQLWQGLGVHQLEIAIEDTPHSSNASLPGIVIALTSSSNESIMSAGMDGITKSVKMWPLQSMVNLVKFRAFSESSECLDLAERSSSTKRSSALVAGTSALAGLMSMFEKGKQKAEGSISNLSDSLSNTFPSHPASAPSRHQSRDSHGHKPSTSHPLPNPLPPSAAGQKSSNQSHLELPLQWAKQTISLNLPRIQAHGPILFIKLSNSPVPGFNPINDQLDQINDSLPAGLRSRSRARTDDGDDEPKGHTPNDGWWYLIIATKQMIFVMESQPTPQRTWHLCAEMSAPFTAKTAHLVLSEFSRSNNNNSRAASHSRTSTLSRRTLNPRLGYGELAVLLTMKEYAVVISLSDLSVRELDLQGAIAASQTTTSISSYTTTTLRPTTGSFSGLSQLERNFKPFGRNSSSISGSIEPVLVNKRIKDGFGKSKDDGFQVENRRSNRLVSDRRWAGCEELLIPVPSQTPNCQNTAGAGGRDEVESEEEHHLRAIYLVTRGYLTYAVICPFGYESRSRSSTREQSSSGIDQHSGLAGGLPLPLLLKPIHTFTWRAIPVKVQAQIIPTPSKWKNVDGKKDPGGGPGSRPSSDEVFCCLTAFTASSVEVQEGFISLKFLRMVWEAGKAKERPHGNMSFFTPASSAHRRRFRQTSASSFSSAVTTSSTDDDLVPPGRLPGARRGPGLPSSPRPPAAHRSRLSISSVEQPFEETEEELNDNSSYDYSAKIGYLCSSAAWFSPSSAPNTLRPNPHIHPLDRNPNSFDSSTSDTTIGTHDNHLPPPHQSFDHHSQQLGSRDFTQGSFFWKQAVGEWKIMFVCNSMDL
ncbi:hypothetical protein PTTG_28138 [Puccinia triticina 1-1 BBBD Race 1]|uniref:Uncharacterized protein n=2 Tax=Puccinia triticina TaxID=208348 RepID=A0A180GE09_PUCT1|nr:uncharacterized protein PtA15_17A101 [Puccinia triticina]OAV90966.1 hypothetical protein PTTG_28138 [Puccinia triticina 1-1 BBBD Race 1]WAQ92619.1 hypothetical protein PtA15_17A101 [Puccinia triticina]WAR63499.1 hypothetical protein PtB15_17B99 [Puccinia triticina]